jgi:hypothetical protein
LGGRDLGDRRHIRCGKLVHGSERISLSQYRGARRLTRSGAPRLAKALFQMFGVFAEFDRSLIHERITAGGDYALD